MPITRGLAVKLTAAVVLVTFPAFLCWADCPATPFHMTIQCCPKTIQVTTILGCNGGGCGDWTENGYAVTCCQYQWTNAMPGCVSTVKLEKDKDGVRSAQSHVPRATRGFEVVERLEVRKASTASPDNGK